MSASILSIWIAVVVTPQLCNSFTKTCGFYGCDGTTINCASNEDCQINCSAGSSCESATINCPSNHECNIHCEGTAACYGITVYAQHSSKLEFTDCKTGTFGHTCSDMTVYCPPNINGNKKCIIPGDNAMGGQYEPYMQFYAINGWNDIDFSGYTGSYTSRKGTMYCTNDYSQSCSIDSSWVTGYWTCADKNNICMHPPTAAPTNMPTETPTVTPTNIPTNSPTKMPTNSPTVNPSNFPTNMPTVTPTNMPTNTPSKSPTKMPTTLPSNTPTEMPSIFPTIPPSIQPSVSPTKAPIKRKSKDTKLVISDDLNNDSLEVKDAVRTTEMNIEQVDEVINVTTKHSGDRLHEYILWIGLGFAALILSCILCIYCCVKRKSKPKIYNIDHYGDTKNIEMEQPKPTGVIVDEDGNETIIPPKKGTIKYSPLGAINGNVTVQSKPMVPQIKVPVSSLSQLSVHSISKVSMDITPISLDSFVLDAQNDDEVLGNDMVNTPQFDNDAIITPQIDDTPQFDDNKADFDVVINEDMNVVNDNIIDDDMIVYVNNDVSVDGNGIIETKGNNVNNIEYED